MPKIKSKRKTSEIVARTNAKAKAKLGIKSKDQPDESAVFQRERPCHKRPHEPLQQLALAPLHFQASAISQSNPLRRRQG